MKKQILFPKREPFLYTQKYPSKAWSLKEEFQVNETEDMAIRVLLHRLHPVLPRTKSFQDFEIFKNKIIIILKIK